MEKSRLEEDPSSLTSFNFIPEGDEEGLISKIFSKFKTAVSSGGSATQQYTSPASSTRTISIVLSNESGMITDQVVPEHHVAEQQQQQHLTKIPSNTSSSATDTIVPAVAATNTATTTPYHPASATPITNNKTDTHGSMASSSSSSLPLPIHTQKSNTTATSANTNINHASVSTTPKEEKETTSTTPHPPAKKAAAKTAAAAAASPASSSLPKQLSKHIIIDEEQNQQQQIPSHIIPLTKTSSIDSDTQSVMTTFSVSNTNSLSRILNRLRGGEPVDSNKDFWMPDEQCKECNNCNAPFNLFRRKHHCRTCGKKFICLSLFCLIKRPLT